MYPPQDIDLTAVDLNLLVVFDVLMRERSVTRSAKELHRTPSAVSHALNRLRDQLGDPLLVRQGSQMVPTELGTQLWIDVKALLKETRELLRRSREFDPRTSNLSVRMAMADVDPHLYAHVYRSLSAVAPGMHLIWVPVHESTLRDLAHGELDFVVLPRPPQEIEALEAEHLFYLEWACAVRAGHPAGRAWNLEQFSAWPHLSVQTGDRLNAPVIARTQEEGVRRHIALVVPQFSAVADILAHTDLIATMPRTMLLAMAENSPLHVLPTPMPLPRLDITFYRNRKQLSDPALTFAAKVIQRSLLELFNQTCQRLGEPVQLPSGG